MAGAGDRRLAVHEGVDAWRGETCCIPAADAVAAPCADDCRVSP
jgi:hypothetical protein